MSCTAAASHDEGVSRIFRSWLRNQEHVCGRVATKAAQESTKCGRGASATWGPMMAGTAVPLSRDGLERLEAADGYMRSWGTTASSAPRTNPNALDAGSRGSGTEPGQYARLARCAENHSYSDAGAARNSRACRNVAAVDVCAHLRPGYSMEPPGDALLVSELPRGLASPRWRKPLALRQRGTITPVARTQPIHP